MVFTPSLTVTSAVYVVLVSKSTLVASPVNESTPVSELIVSSDPVTDQIKEAFSGSVARTVPIAV